MANLLTEEGLVQYELGSELTKPIRALFLALEEEQESPELDVIIELSDDETLQSKLPFVATINNKNFYSLPYQTFKMIDFSTSGSAGEVITASITNTESLIEQIMKKTILKRYFGQSPI